MHRHTHTGCPLTSTRTLAHPASSPRTPPVPGLYPTLERLLKGTAFPIRMVPSGQSGRLRAPGPRPRSSETERVLEQVPGVGASRPDS